MNQEQLMDQYLRLQRKLAASYSAWHSGRVDRLAVALRRVEQELRAGQVEPQPVTPPAAARRVPAHRPHIAYAV